MKYIEVDLKNVKAAIAGFTSWWYLTSSCPSDVCQTVVGIFEKYPTVVARAMQQALREINLTTDRTPPGIIWRDLSKKLTQSIMQGELYGDVNRQKRLQDIMLFLEEEYHQEVRAERNWPQNDGLPNSDKQV